MGGHEDTYTHFSQGKIMKIILIYSNISYANESCGKKKKKNELALKRPYLNPPKKNLSAGF